MTDFYFNSECIPQDINIKVFHQLFKFTLVEYQKLLSLPQLQLSPGIITEKQPSEVIFKNFSLLEAFEKLNDKDLKTSAYSYFNKYPIENFISSNNEEILEKKYSIELNNSKKEIFYLPYIFYAKGIAFTLAYYTELKINEISVTTDDSEDLKLENLWGEVCYKIKKPITDSERKNQINEFKDEIKSNQNHCYILFINYNSNWTIISYNNNKEIIEEEIQNHDPLFNELEKQEGERDVKKIFELSNSKLKGKLQCSNTNFIQELISGLQVKSLNLFEQLIYIKRTNIF
ncbi:MAG: hypothetical protein H7A23_07500 [Leptospiraceae bacterium]|nr:hypothetical protein [Leptospiraceae bacterium]